MLFRQQSKRSQEQSFVLNTSIQHGIDKLIKAIIDTNEASKDRKFENKDETKYPHKP